MTSKRLKIYIIIFILLSGFSVTDFALCADSLNCYQVGFHLDSNLSGGFLSISELAEMAVDNNLDAVIICDHDVIEIEYGVLPFRNLIKKKYVQPSINTFGFDEYFNLVDSVNREFDNLTVIAGAETNPRYYWENDPFGDIFPLSEFSLDRFNFKDLTLRNWHQHMIVLGMRQSSEYLNTPTTANKIHPDLSYYKKMVKHNGLPGLFNTRGWLYILAIIGILFSFYLFFHTGMSKVDVLGQKMAYRKKPRRKTAIILALLCLLFLVDGYPFTPWLNSPYVDYERVEATQDVINYVIEKDGLIFFAHPESEYDTDVVGMKMKTHPYSGLLLKNLNYTGFAVFGEGWNAAGNPGGFWDKVLMQYCSGEREQPVWAVGELDFDGELPNEFLKEVATFVWAEDNSEVAILDALKNGRCYASQFFGSKIIWLEEWNVTNLSTGETAISGQTLNTDKSVNIHFKIAVSQNYSPKFGKDEFRAYLINNGNIIQQIAFSQEFNSNFTEILPEGLCYFRLWIMQGENNPIIASNPIFINRIKDEEL